ncbi:hypothetical protein ACFLX8_04905, partial [Chloroflexota bacterium]
MSDKRIFPVRVLNFWDSFKRIGLDNRTNLGRFIKSDYILLLPVLVLAVYMTLIPHSNYSYPLHVDEWSHLAYSQATLQAGSTTYINPFDGQSIIGLESPNLEAGYHLFLGIVQQVTNVPWFYISRYMPGAIFMLTAFVVYILGRRHGFGWEAAFFTCMIPTTVGILGPAFLV